MRILHLQCLQDAPDRAVEVASIASAMGVAPGTLDVVRPFEDEVAPSRLDGAAGVTIGGSALSVFYAIPRYGAFARLLVEARSRGVPIFGICFGAQAVADVFGGKVIRDLAHAEYGTVDVGVARESAELDWPVFFHAPSRFAAQAWHRDRIVRLPTGARAIAWSRDGRILQAFKFIDEPIWGVQFHPERDLETFMRLLETRADPPDRSVADIRATLRPSPDAAALLKRFADLCAKR
jgi:GMP synthase-like glutamine amidotransferase